MTLAERQTARERIEEMYIAQARVKARVHGRSMRCGQHVEWYGDSDHSLCRGEESGARGCLCECHDTPPSALPGGGTNPEEDQR
jgi:hypothetical protein